MQRFRLTGSLVANRRHRPHSRTRVMPVQVKGDWHWVGMERHRGEFGERIPPRPLRQCNLQSGE